jgi:hypothetical protein
MICLYSGWMPAFIGTSYICNGRIDQLDMSDRHALHLSAGEILKINAEIRGAHHMRDRSGRQHGDPKRA